MTEAGYARILLDKKDTQIMELESEITKLRIEYERQIMELQKENAELKKSCDETQELLDKQIEATYKLVEENAELKKENESLTSIKNIYIGDLLKAKEIIEKVTKMYRYSPRVEELIAEAEQFLSCKEILNN